MAVFAEILSERLQIRMRSGLAYYNGLTMTNGIGTIDSGYRGEICVLISNLSNNRYIINPGDRICQCKVAYAPKIELIMQQELSQTERSNTGFGSSGIK